MSSDVTLREGETQDSLLRRFQRAIQMNGILREAKAHRLFVSKRDAARIKQKITPGGDYVWAIRERDRKLSNSHYLWQ